MLDRRASNFIGNRYSVIVRRSAMKDESHGETNGGLDLTEFVTDEGASGA